MAGPVLRKRKSRSDEVDSTPCKKRVVQSLDNVNDENAPVSYQENLLKTPSRISKTYILSPDGENSSPVQRLVRANARSPLSPATVNGEYISPLKRKSVVIQRPIPLTPTTPRFKDVLGTTVRSEQKIIVAPHLPLTPKTPRTKDVLQQEESTPYSLARQAFAKGSVPDELIGREDERAKLKAFLQKSCETRQGQCLYISGPPGTGKSAYVREACQEIKDLEDAKLVSLNCMSIRNAADFYARLLMDFAGEELDSASEACTRLENIFFPVETSEVSYILVLDEVDHLLMLDNSLLYNLFGWALDQTSCLSIVGIANALNLTDRFLPRLKAKNLIPQLLPFGPYTAKDITSIVTAKLQALVPPNERLPTTPPLLHPLAISLCAKKVAASSGDLRKVFDLVQTGLEVIEREYQQKQNGVTSGTESTRILDLPKVTIAHMSRIAAAAFNNGTSERLKTLNLQQRAVLAAMIVLEKRHATLLRDTMLATPSKSKLKLTQRKLYETYSTSLCGREDACHPLTATEFADVVSSLEGAGLIQECLERSTSARQLNWVQLTPSKKAVSESRRLAGRVSEQELMAALQGPGGDFLARFIRSADY